MHIALHWFPLFIVTNALYLTVIAYLLIVIDRQRASIISRAKSVVCYSSVELTERAIARPCENVFGFRGG